MTDVQSVATLIAGVLGRRSIGADENFFFAGGDSVRASMVVSRLLDLAETHGAVDDPALEARLLGALFDEGTADALAAVLRSSQPTQKDVPLRRVAASGDVPASFAQMRLWLPSRLHVANPAYNIAVVRAVRGDFDEHAFRAAVALLIERHEALRTTLRIADGELTQYVHPEPCFEWSAPVAVSAQSASTEARQWYTGLAARPFEPTDEPVVRAGVFRLSPSSCVVALIISHAAADGWSMATVFEELSELYAAHRSGRQPDLAPVPIQYSDYATWEHARLDGGILEPGLRYWSDRLVDAPELLDLTPWKQRPTLDDVRGATFTLRLGRERNARVHAFAEREHTTPYAVWLAAFEALLYRYTQQDDFVVGAPFAARIRTELEPMVGFVANTVLLRAQVTHETTPHQLVQAAQTAIVDAMRHQDVPFESVIRALRPRRDLRWTPFLQVMLIYQNTPHGTLRFAGAEVDVVAVDTGSAKFDLTAELLEADGDLECRFEYRTGIVDATWIAAFGRRYGTVVDRFLDMPDVPIAELEILAPKERMPLTGPAHGKDPFGDDATLWALFARVADSRLDERAVVTADTVHTFGDLLRRARELGERLAAHAIGSGSIVAVRGGRGFETIAAYLAVNSLGAVFCPLSPGAPERNVEILAHSDAAVLIDIERGASTGVSSLQSSGVPLPSDTAYLLYTSGSTGRPKGVLGTTAGLLNRLRWMWQQWPFVDGELHCHRVAPTFVDSLWDIFGPLLAGVPLAVPPMETETDVKALVRFLKATGATRITLVPGMLRVILDVLENGETLPRLWQWTCSGEALPVSTANRFHSLLSNRTLLNLYGCTECAGDSTWYVVERDRPDGRVPIGRPISGTSIRIADAAGRPVIPGTPGELYIGGIGIAHGYHRDAAATERHFVEGEGARERWFRTFDIARAGPTGVLELLDRADSEVSVRGFRLDVEAVRECMLSHPFVADAAVIPIRNAEGEVSLAAYIVSNKTIGSQMAAFRSYLAARLAGPMVPSSIMVVPELPRTPHGKLNHAALPRPGISVDSPQPRNETERRIVTIWTDILGNVPPGIHDDFFEVGGDSLAANRVMARIEMQFGHDIPLTEFYRQPTVAALAERVLEAEIDRADADILARALSTIRNRRGGSGEGVAGA